jgi:hypothetical protein
VTPALRNLLGERTRRAISTGRNRVRTLIVLVRGLSVADQSRTADYFNGVEPGT